MPSPVEFARSQQPRFLEELKSLLRIPSVSTLPEHKGDVRRAAETLAAELKRIGLENVRVIETSGHPLVYGDWLHAAGKPNRRPAGRGDVPYAGPSESLPAWRMSLPFTMKIVSSPRLVAWSPIRSRYLAIDWRRVARKMLRGSSIM